MTILYSSSIHGIYINVYLILLVYVNDIIVCSSKIDAIKELNDTLHGLFKIKDLGEARFFLGMEVTRNKFGITFNSKKEYFVSIKRI